MRHIRHQALLVKVYLSPRRILAVDILASHRRQGNSGDGCYLASRVLSLCLVTKEDSNSTEDGNHPEGGMIRSPYESKDAMIE